jgi:hypothetical protein
MEGWFEMDGWIDSLMDVLMSGLMDGDLAGLSN